jgi:hypothetical protein
MAGTGYLKAAFESTPGNETNTPTLSTKILYTPAIEYQPNLGPDGLLRDDELRGIDEPIAGVPDDYTPDWNLSTRMYPDVAGFYLKSILGAPVTTAGNGVITDPDGTVIPTGCYRHVWTAPFGPAGANPQTMEVIAAYKDQSVFLKQKGAACDELAITTPDKGGAMMAAKGPTLYQARIADPSLTPSLEALTVLPFVRGNLSLPTNLASTGTTEDFNVTISAPAEATSSLGIASSFPDVMEKGDPPIVFSGSIPKRQFTATDYDALLNMTGFALKAKWLSAVVIAAAYRYTLWMQFLNAQYVSGAPEGLASKRRLGATFDWKSTYAGTAGSSIVTLVNATSSLA